MMVQKKTDDGRMNGIVQKNKKTIVFEKMKTKD